MATQQRSVSGIYFRYQNPDTQKLENWTFEDLPEEKQNEILDSKDHEFVKGLARIMAKKLREVCDQFDIAAE